MVVLLFRYVFGGAIIAAGVPGGYVNYLMPAIFVQTVCTGNRGVQGFATYQPVGECVAAVRALMVGGPQAAAPHVIGTLLWCAAWPSTPRITVIR